MVGIFKGFLISEIKMAATNGHNCNYANMTKKYKQGINVTINNNNKVLF